MTLSNSKFNPSQSPERSQDHPPDDQDKPAKDELNKETQQEAERLEAADREYNLEYLRKKYIESDEANLKSFHDMMALNFKNINRSISDTLNDEIVKLKYELSNEHRTVREYLKRLKVRQQ